MGYFFNFSKLEYLTGKKPSGCILCNVVAGDGDTVDLTVFESERFVVSLNLYPYNPGHLLLFPKRHVTDIRALDPGERAEMDGLLTRCLDALDEVQKPKAYNVGYNMGKDAGASIDHLHLHIIPRYPHEIGIVELIAGARVLVQDPKDTRELLKKAFERQR